MAGSSTAYHWEDGRGYPSHSQLPTRYSPGGGVDDEAPRLVYNPDDGSVEIRLGGRSVTVDGIDAEIVFERMTPEVDAAAPLWLAPEEADVLRKMIGYILERVRITEASKATLAALLPRVQAIADAEAGADGGAGENGAGRSPAGGAPGGSSGRSGSGGGRDAAGGRDADGGTGGRGDGGREGRGGGGSINVPGVRRGLARPDDEDDGD